MKNILIQPLSTFKANADDNYYSYSSDEHGEITVIGSQTSETIPKLLIEQFRRIGERLDTVIMLCTDETELLNDPNDPCGECLSDMIQRIICQTACYTPSFHKVFMKNESDSAQLFNASINIKCFIEKDANVYVDCTGGYRDTIMSIISSLQLLRFEKICVKDVFYVNYFRGSTQENPCKVYTRTEAYNIFELISGLDEFWNYGSTKKLTDYFGDSLTLYEKNVLNSLTELSSEMQLCRVLQITKAIERLKNALNDYEALQSPKSEIFSTLVKYVKEHFSDLLSNDSVNELTFIRWCFENGYISQTLSFYYETVPKFLVDKRIIYPSDSLQAEIATKARNTHNVDRAWQYLFVSSRLLIQSSNYSDWIEKTKSIVKSPEPDKTDERAQYFSRIFRAFLLSQKGSPIKDQNIEEEYNRFKKTAAEYNINIDALKDKNKLKNVLCSNEKLLLQLFGLTADNVDKTDADLCAEKAISCIDNIRVFSDYSLDAVKSILRDYYYIYNQRNNILHAGENSDSPDNVKKYLEKAIERLTQTHT